MRFQVFAHRWRVLTIATGSTIVLDAISRFRCVEGVIAGTSTASTDAPNCSVQRVFNGLVSAISGHNKVVRNMPCGSNATWNAARRR